MKSKKYIIILILLLIGIYIINYNSMGQKISRDLEIYIPRSLKFEYKDTHGGFFGDGVLIAKADLNEKQLNQIIDKSDMNWNETPTPLGLKEFLHEPLRGMSEMKNGYWIFKDRISKGPKGELPKTIIGNYSLGLIDLDSNNFYYIKFDS